MQNLLVNCAMFEYKNKKQLLFLLLLGLSTSIRSSATAAAASSDPMPSAAETVVSQEQQLKEAIAQAFPELSLCLKDEVFENLNLLENEVSLLPKLLTKNSKEVETLSFKPTKVSGETICSLYVKKEGNYFEFDFFWEKGKILKKPGEMLKFNIRRAFESCTEIESYIVLFNDSIYVPHIITEDMNLSIVLDSDHSDDSLMTNYIKETLNIPYKEIRYLFLFLGIAEFIAHNEKQENLEKLKNIIINDIKERRNNIFEMINTSIRNNIKSDEEHQQLFELIKKLRNLSLIEGQTRLLPNHLRRSFADLNKEEKDQIIIWTYGVLYVAFTNFLSRYLTF